MQQTVNSLRKINDTDLRAIKQLTVDSWSQFRPVLDEESWARLHRTLTNDDTYLQLFKQSHGIASLDNNQQITGTAFLVPSGNPSEIYPADWCYIRFVTVHPDFGGRGIGKQLTRECIRLAKMQNEKIIALHTSEFMHAARHVYESLGFTIYKEIEPRFGKRYWLYTLNLVQ